MLRTPLLGVVATGALLAAGAGSAFAQSPVTQTFTAAQTIFTVPANVNSLTITAQGGSGGNALAAGGGVLATGGQGGNVTTTIPVSPGERLWLLVGANGANSSAATGYAGGGGGGATDVRTCAPGGTPTSCPGGVSSLQTRLVVAGGGGGAGGSAAGGNGGSAGNAGQDGISSIGSGGAAGTTNGGGNGGSGTDNPGAAGTFPGGGAGGQQTGASGGGTGGTSSGGGGGNGGGTTMSLSGGGGGGAGYYGGGGGAGSDPLDAGGGGGGGGGASYVTPSGTNTTITWGSGQPSVTLTYTPTQPVVVVPPQVQGVSPTSGTTAGGYTVTISGIYFGSARQVYFGNVAAPQFTVQGFNTITAVVPASQIAGTFDVRVVGPGGLMSPIAQPADQFTYTAVPAPAPAPTPTPTPTPAPPTPSTSTICRVPNVIGTTLSQARSLLRTAHCSLGTVEGTTSRGNRVARQTIPAGTRLVPGDKVGLRMRAIKRGKH